MQQFSDAFKARVVQRLVGRRAMSANVLAEEVGVSQASLSRWLRAARSVGKMTPSSKKPWSGAMRNLRASTGWTAAGRRSAPNLK
jgi:transposase-like protein